MPKVLWLLLATLVFAFAYAQAPLYYSNQNQYFLHGLAHAHVGHLDEDWLASTDDPTPLFSLFVAFTARFLHPFFFHVAYALLLGVFFVSMIGIFSHSAGARDSVNLRLVFAAVLVASFCALGRWLSNLLFDLDLPWYVQAGVAGQYVLGAMLQPSSLGILLVLAICLYVRGKPFLAVLAACVGATIHVTYLLAAGMLTAAFMFGLWREGQPRRALLLGVFALALVLPVTIYVMITFGATSVEDFQNAQHLLAHFRIPHHALVYLWLDPIALTQIAWMLLGLGLSYGTRLFHVLAVPMLLGALLTLAQVVSGSDTLALLFPWRVSAVLMPVATGVILSRLVLALRRWLDRKEALVASTAVLGALALAGLAVMFFRLGFQSMTAENAMMNHVKANKRPGEVYLVPVEVPNLKATVHGSKSSDFQPLAAKKTETNIIPIDLMRFRLYTEAPIYVDFKAIPYRDQDVLEWKRRLDLAKSVYDAIDAGEWDAVRERVAAERISHVVVDAGKELKGSAVEEVYGGDGGYRIYRLK
jgi:hypothetical protein